MNTYHADAWRQHGGSYGAVLKTKADLHPDRVFIHLLEDGLHDVPITYGDMDHGATRVAAALHSRGVRRGDRVLVVLPTGRDFLELFFGIIMAGAVVVPCYPPLRSKGITDYQERLAKLMRIADPALIVTFPKARIVVEAAAFKAGLACQTVEPGALQADLTGWQMPEVHGDDLALVQFSSGSTGTPRGVMLTHRNLLENVLSVMSTIGPSEHEIGCSWLPLYHDMGLIGGLLMPLCCSGTMVLLSPQSFLFDPKRWLWAIHNYRATISTAPNFAYQMLATRLSDVELAGLDLSCWRLALSGAEPVVPGTLAAFHARFAPYGFRQEALTPVYGLAEVALAAVFPILDRGPRYDAIDPAALAADGLAVPFVASEAAPDKTATLLASVGQALPGFSVRIVGPGSQVLAERHVGEIQLQGPSVMRGYLKNPEATAKAFDEAWLRTGDLGYVADGELYIVGRIKDVIIKGGKKYVPQDLELVAEQIGGVRKGCVVAFGVPDPETGTEAVVVVAETRQPAEEHEAMAKLIANAVHLALGMHPDHVRLVAPGTIPKTSSGKLQRSRSREFWLTGNWQAPAEPTLLNKTKLVGQALVQRFIKVNDRTRTSEHV
ncbi:MAG: fatty acyl-AMP ligase [Candidatus Sericytochromatia bacterium]|nr:fatty acyl-AMP ligase [Candidatus Sericytochromatia bacterium]